MATKRVSKKRAKQNSRCALCGKFVPPTDSAAIVGRTGKRICSACTCVWQVPQPQNNTPDIFSHGSIITPSDMVTELNHYIIGQETAKHAVALALWKQQLRAHGTALPKSGLLLYGPSGCGKTALVQQAAELAGVPFLAFDSTTLIENGYRGRDVEEVVQELIHRFGEEQAQYGVVFLDEIDKLAAHRDDPAQASHYRAVQHALLKLVEGTEIPATKNSFQTFSTKNILFVFGGAFRNLSVEQSQRSIKVLGFGREDYISGSPSHEPLADAFIRYGMEPELIGRIGRFIPLSPLTQEQLQEILLHAKTSVYRQYQRFFQTYGIEAALTASEINALTEQALRQGLGARGLNTLVEEWIEPKLIELSIKTQTR